MNKHQLQNKCGYLLPSDIDFQLSDHSLEVTLGDKSVTSNIQDDSSAFEGWIICLIACLSNDSTNRIDNVSIRFKPNFNISNSPTPKERQLYYRLFKANQNFGWKIPRHNAIQQIESNLEGAILTIPSGAAKTDAQNTEAQLERIYIAEASANGRSIHQQLPIGLFNGSVAEANRLTPTSHLDMWELSDNNTLNLYELKAKDNRKVGIISELMYYTNMVSDIIHEKYKFNTGTEHRGIKTLKDLQKSAVPTSINGIFLTDGLHPMIEQYKDAITEILNRKDASYSRTTGISYSFRDNKDNLTEYSTFREQERARQERLLDRTDDFVFPHQATGNGWYKGSYRTFCLSEGQEDLNLYPGIRTLVSAYFNTQNISFWGKSDTVPNHILSSQVSCLNHLFAIREDEDAVLAIAKAMTGRTDLKKMLRLECDTNPQFIAFEVISKADHLNEKELKRGAFCTSIDAVMLAELQAPSESAQQRRLLIMIEWKYTESYSRLDKSSEDDPHKPMQPQAKGIERLNRYCDLISNSQYLKPLKSKDCENELELPAGILPYKGSIYFQEPYYQLMRQTLWAEQMIASNSPDSPEKIKATEFMHIHVVPSANTDLLNKGFGDYDYCPDLTMPDSWQRMLRRQDIYKCIDPEVIREALPGKYDELHEYLTNRYPKSMNRLQNALESFTPSDSIDGLTKQFEQIAQIVFNGRLIVNGKYEIYPIDIEFYFQDEKDRRIIEPQMYHTGDLPYFPIGSICPNRSGVDMTFERKGLYRASFLMRGYTYKSLTDADTYTNSDGKKQLAFKPQYLWEDLFGNASIFGNGLSIVWADNEDYKKVNIQSSARVNIKKIDGEDTDRMWHFTNLDAIRQVMEAQ